MKVKLLDVEKHLQLHIGGHEQVDQALPVSLGQKRLDLRIFRDHRCQGHGLAALLIEFLQETMVVTKKAFFLLFNDEPLLGGEPDDRQEGGPYESKEKERDEEFPFQTQAPDGFKVDPSHE
jgi:hypothetical protein